MQLFYAVGCWWGCSWWGQWRCMTSLINVVLSGIYSPLCLPKMTVWIPSTCVLRYPRSIWAHDWHEHFNLKSKSTLSQLHLLLLFIKAWHIQPLAHQKEHGWSIACPSYNSIFTSVAMRKMQYETGDWIAAWTSRLLPGPLSYKFNARALLYTKIGRRLPRSSISHFSPSHMGLFRCVDPPQ